MVATPRQDSNGWVTCTRPPLFGLEACQTKFKPFSQTDTCCSNECTTLRFAASRGWTPENSQSVRTVLDKFKSEDRLSEARRQAALLVPPEVRRERMAKIRQLRPQPDEAAMTTKWGPKRQVTSVLSTSPSGKSTKVLLECGHEASTSPGAKHYRCWRCR